MTKLREMERQSPLPYLASPMRKRRCSSSVHGMPLRRSVSWLFTLRCSCATDSASPGTG
jgi:hypothetical protein